jgi:ATP-dependent helicase/nuclease subunit A
VSEPTQQQQKAIDAAGSVLLSAGAGTGKTATLVNRCVRLVAEPGVSVEDFLVVTFTNAAAAEMKQRLREELHKKLADKPGDDHLQKQLLLLESAHISTIHAFCLELIRAHFSELKMDPGVGVLEESVTRPLEREISRSVVVEAIEVDQAVQELAENYFGGNGDNLAEQIRKTHQFYVKQSQAEKLLADDLKSFEPDKPVRWQEWRNKIIVGWLLGWQKAVAWQTAKTCEALANKIVSTKKSEKTDGIQNILERLPLLAKEISWLNEKSDSEKFVAALKQAVALSGDDVWGSGTKIHRGVLKDFFEDAAELATWLPAGSLDPLEDEWNLVRGPMRTLLQLTQKFSAEFSAAKRALGGVDFSDLEQLALQLLADDNIASQWRARFKHVFVDECQDINAAQDALIQTLSRPDASNSLFMVGDVKQSIYRFRLAAPKLFRNYSQDWRNKEHHQVLALNENFRSRAGILAFANDLFGCLMGAGFGGVCYNAEDRLQFAAPEKDPRAPLSINPPEDQRPQNHWSEADCRVELHLVDTSAAANDGETGGGESKGEGWDDLLNMDQQARVVAGRLRQMMDGKHQVWDKREKAFRHLKWGDVGLLMRAVSGRAGAFLREFRRQDIPLVVEQGDFLSTLEAHDLTALLQVLDNPRQDIPLFAVLRSPLVGLSLDELVEIRSAREKDAFDSLTAAKENKIVARFLEQLERWRRLALMTSLSCVLETVLTETRYEAFLHTLDDGADRAANVRRFLDLARRYDPLQRQGLHRFLKFIAQQQEAGQEIEPLPPRQPDAVQLMSIHKSKGLEFPVVVLAGIGSRFHQPELNQGILFSRDWGGIAPQVVDARQNKRQDSLVRWWVRREERSEAIAEELRLLYVAVTRARDTLLLVGSFNPGSKTWIERTSCPVEFGVSRAASYCEWIGMWLGGQLDWTSENGETSFQAEGQNARLRWQIHAGSDLPATANKQDSRTLPESSWVKPAEFSWIYSHLPATTAPAKTSASALRRLGTTMDEEAAPLLPTQQHFVAIQTKPSSALGAAAAGTAHHTFLQYLDLAMAGSAASLAGEAKRLCELGILSGEESAALDLSVIAHFWQTATGREILAQDSKSLRRELAFTASFLPDEIPALKRMFPGGADEFIVVQGAVDLAVILPAEIWIVDFKTDHIDKSEAASRVAEHSPQIRLYAAALERIYCRPVKRAILHFLHLGLGVDVVAPVEPTKT